MSTTSTTWRCILSGVGSGARNMATDHAIQEAVALGAAPPTLRLYAWDPPCLSLGFAQPLAQVDRARANSNGWEVVRRPTGGRAILHTDELTYSIVLPEADALVAGGVLESYHRLSRGIVEGLALIWISAISIWEIAKKVEKRQLTLDRPFRQWLQAARGAPGLYVAELTSEILVESCELPQPFHGDPADQMIVATVRHHNGILVTRDEALRSYAHLRTLW